MLEKSLSKGDKERKFRILGDENKPNYRFYQETYKEKRDTEDGKQIVTKEYVLIMLEQEKDGIKRSVIHPVTDYLLKQARKNGGAKVKTQSTKASYIVKFLNYIWVDNGEIYKVKGLGDLTFEQGVEFLNYYGTTGVKKSTVKRCEETLKNLYFFLAQEGILKTITTEDFKILYNSKEDSYLPNRYLESPFYGVEYPSGYEINDILHHLPLELVVIFIDTAIQVTPRIALGVYFQMFGGLRLGEVVNVKKTGIRLKGAFGKYGMVLSLSDQRFRSDLRSITSGGAVKKSRKQAIYPYVGGLLEKIYKSHIENYQVQDGSEALFVNRAGDAMADFTYRYYFTKLKEAFIQRLKDSKEISLMNYAVDLQSKKWSTHLGRGVFSNMIAEVAPNVTMIATARGDSSLESSLVYLSDSQKMAKELFENQKDMWNMLTQEIDLAATKGE